MKTLGIVGGIAPASTVEYYRLILAAYRERKGDGSYPSILINSIDMKRMLDLIAANELAQVTEYLVGEVRRLANAGADFGLLASNTPHIVFDAIRHESPLPLISIVEATREAVKALNVTRVGLFGTRFVMQGDFYFRAFSRDSITLVTPNADEQSYIHHIYMSELVNGQFLDDTRSRLLAILDRLREQEGIQALILGGTELPFILNAEDVGRRTIPFLDTTRIHAEQAVSQMLA